MENIRRYPALLLAPLLLLAWASPAAAKFPHSPCKERDKKKLPGCVKKHHSTDLKPYTRKEYKDNGLEDTLTKPGRYAKGFYLTSYWVHRVTAEKTARIMKKAHMNAVVVNFKDDLGQVVYPSKVPLTKGLQKHLMKKPAEYIKALKDLGIYVIARIVCFKDSRLPYKRPDLATRIGKKARRIMSAGANWIDPYSDEVQDYIIDLALEAQSLGADEVQLDYIRFPKGKAGYYSTWLHKAKREEKVDRATLIANFLGRVDRAITVPLSVDVFGLTTLVDGDPRGLGQDIAKMGKYIDAISPMLYANGMEGYFKGNKVTRRVYGIIHCGVWRAKRKIPHVVMRPFLQSYPNSVEHMFGTDFIKQQVLVSEKGGSEGFLWWNSSMKNRVAYTALKRMGKKYLDAFGTTVDQYKDPKKRPGRWCPSSGSVFGQGKKKAKKDKK